MPQKQQFSLETIRHSASHVLAMAVLDVFPDAKLGIGPAIEDGFYYDFDLARPLTPEDLPKLEKKMQDYIKKNLTFKKEAVPKKEALKIFKGQPYKLELIKEIPESKISLYRTGKFVDLCKGPHVEKTSQIKVFKLLQLAGAYWKGDEKNKMLQRVYGTAFNNEKDLKNYLALLEEAKKRDHRIFGKNLDLFSFHPEGPGFAFFHPQGMVLVNTILDFWRKMHKLAGYKEIRTPIILSRKLWEKSGHWELYKENMYTLKIEEQDYAVKPMNCPGGMLIYKEKMHSYKELPLRIAELGTVHRHELSGVLAGLFRVRQFTQDDAHIFCTKEQLEQEITEVLDLAFAILKKFGFKDFVVTLSLRDEKHKGKYLGDDKIWRIAEKTLESALKKKRIAFRPDPGEAKFYGPSIDIKIKDALGREWQTTTIQLDFNTPKRFNLEYIAEDGKKHQPIMLHRTILGSLERFIGILLEHYAGALPLWLAPTQIVILPLADRFISYAKKVAQELQKIDVRVEIDDRSESVSKKIRDDELKKIPFMLVVGEKEKKAKKVAVRKHGKGDLGPILLSKFIKQIQKELEQIKL